MTFPAYPEYKPSGFDWLPEVPAHWMDRKIARDIPFVVGWTPPSGKDEYYDGDLPWVTIADMTQMTVEDTKSKISHLAVRDKGAKVVPAGSMLFSFKLSVGKIAFLTIDSYTNEAIAGFLPCGPLDLEYWKYAAPEFIPRYGRENIYGATLLNQELISSVRFFAPARVEQTQIARFLDHETARIDALIEEQQRLIELLKEKRQAVISHAVTKGLDPTVPMKDSGVEWLGEVPAHWDVLPVWMLFQMGRGRVISHDEIAENGGDYPVYSSQTERDGVMGCIDTYDFEGDYLTWTTDGANAGTVFRRSGRFNCTNVCGTLLPKSKKYDLRYFVDAVGISTAAFIRHDINPKLMNNVMASIKVPVPPLIEQLEIASYVSAFKEKESVLSKEAFSGISLLQERRSALISAAVTGKIDVRGWQPPANTQAPKLEVAEAN